MARFVIGLIIGGVLVMGIASGGQGGGGAGQPETTPAPGTWVDAPMQAPTGSILAQTDHCRRGYEGRQLHPLWEPEPWQSTYYRCRPAR